MLNQCNECGKFKPYDQLQYQAGDSDDVGNYDEWFVCKDCEPEKETE